MPAHPLRRVARQVGHDRRDVLRVARGPHRGLARQAPARRQRRLPRARDRVDHPGRRRRQDGVGRHAEARQPVRAAQRQPDDPRLGRRVVRLPRRPEGRGRGEVDQPSAAPLLAEPDRRPAAGVERPLQVDVDHRLPLLRAHVEDHPVAQDARHVDDDVEAAELVDRLLDHRPGPVEVGDRVAVEDRALPARVELPRDLLRDRHVGPGAVEGGPEVVDDERRPLARQQPRDPAPDPPPGAGHQRDLAVQ